MGEVEIVNSKQLLGAFFSEGRSLTIVDIKPGGLIDKYNQSNPIATIKLNDAIESVNGVKIKDTSHFLDLVKSADRVRLKLTGQHEPELVIGLIDFAHVHECPKEGD